jgi:hypothetical protein
VITRLTGRKARGYRRRRGSSESTRFLLAHGFYDSSLMGADTALFARRGIASSWQALWLRRETALIEMPISWSLDDYPHFEFVRTATTVLFGLPATVMENCRRVHTCGSRSIGAC